ncbi:MAG: stage III sporulation protein AB [Lachnospiraceae bacterium]|nr:stage III sporulation protein AB [Lachnospiraceae bacterium]MDE7415283.1 stage III sporulation protein AB [Lachnospiraceae bacterium]
MWQKLVAGACVMTGALGFGWSLCGEMNSDIQHLRQQKQILLYISGEITYLHRPMEEIFDLIACKAESPYDLFLSDVSRSMKERNGNSLINIWNEAIHARKNGVDFSQTGLEYLAKMGNCFEYEGEQLQVEALRLFELELDSEIDRLTVRKNENSRLIKALSTLTGILCIILFL